MFSRTFRLLATTVAVLFAMPAYAQLQDYDNDRLNTEILALGAAHNLAFAPSFSPDPIVGLNAGNATYASNLGLKYVPPVLEAPSRVGYRPNSTDDCSYTFTISGSGTKQRKDYLGLITNYEDDFEWSSRLGSPQVFHANTDVAVSVYQGSEALSGTVTLPVGSHSLRWRGQTLVTPILDYPPWHLLLAEALEQASRKAVVALKTPAARQKAMEAIVGLALDLGVEGVTFGLDWFVLDSVPTPTFGRGIYNERLQEFKVFDTVPPVITPLRTDFTVEATQVGGEYLRDHIDELRAGIEVSDACGRRPIVNYSGAPFMPVGETTEVRWTARDMGPVDIDGGFNSAEFVQRVQVQDTLPPIVVPPAGRVIEASAAMAIDLGRPAVFDLADVRPTVVSDAPATFPANSRTQVTWRATDASGNATTANQWITLKAPGSNTAPVAEAIAANARTFEPREIELRARDDDLLSGRYDQLTFRITRPPANGFFEAPLFPYFIEDYRVENEFGLIASELNDYLNDECFADRSNFVPPNDFVLGPRYITVDDDGIAYVSDQYYICRNSSGQIERKDRIARFIKNADDQLEFDVQIDTGSNRPDSLSIGKNGFLYYRGTPVDSTTETVRGCDPDLSSCAVYRVEVDTSINNPDRLLPTASVKSITADENDVLYVTDGNYALAAYDLRNVDDNYPALLGPIAGVGDLGSGGMQRKDLAMDSAGNIYLSDFDLDRIYKFSASTIVRNDDGSVEFTPGDFIGWMGRCDANLTGFRACDEVSKTSYGYTCTPERCSVAQTSGSAPGQFNQPQGIALDANDVLYVTDHQNLRVQRFTEDGFFAGEAESECDGSCFVLGDFGNPEDVSANLEHFYVLDRERDLLHVFETTPITDFDDDTLQPTQTARVTYVADDGFTGTDSFGFAVTDGLASSNEAAVTVSVARNFRPPVADAALAFTGTEDETLDLTLSAFDPDAADQPNLVYRIETQPEHGILSGAGPTFTYVPDPDFHGTETFAWSATDGGMDSEVVEATIDVAPVNDPPEISFGELRDSYGAGFPITFEANFVDVDFGDSHVYGIDWGPGEPFATGTVLPPGQVAPEGEPSFIASADGSALLIDTATYFDYGQKTITVCASDVPGVTSLSSCNDPNVSALATRNVTIEAMVSKAVVITDTAPTETAELGFERPLPIVDGQSFDIRFRIHNLQPNDVGQPLDATDVVVTARLGDGLRIAPRGILGIAGDGSGVDCGVTERQLDCSIAEISVAAYVDVTVAVEGDGSVFEESDVPVMAIVTSAEADHNGSVGNTKTYPMTPDPNGDADGDGVANRNDAFPGDPNEQSDFDGDGIGDNADLDDDDDSMHDDWERRFGLDDRNDGDASADGDGDSLTNAEEFAQGSRPDTDDSDRDGARDGSDNCPALPNPNQYDGDADALGDACDPDAFAAAVALGDIDGAGAADFALLKTDAGNYDLFLKDSETDRSILASRLDLGDSAERTLVGLAASGGDVLSLHVDDAGIPRLARYDTAAGATIFDVALADDGRTPAGLLVAGGEVWVTLTTSGGDLSLQRVAATDGRPVATLDLGAGYDPLGVVALAGGGGRFASASLRRDSGDVVVRVHAVADGALQSTVTVADSSSIAAKITALAEGFAVATQSVDGDIGVSAWDEAGNPLNSFAVFDADWTLLDIHHVRGAATEAVAVVALSVDGELQARVIGLDDGATFETRDYATPDDEFRAALVSTDEPTEIGVLLASRTNAVSLELQAAEGAPAARTVLAEANAPPSPPPPPPPPGGNGGGSSGGGGGSTGWFLLLALLSALRGQSLFRTARSSRTLSTARCGRRSAGRASRSFASATPLPTATAMAPPSLAIRVSRSRSSPTTATEETSQPSRLAADASATGDGFPIATGSTSVTLVIMADTARELPSARPPRVAKNGTSEAANSLAPFATASIATSISSSRNSRYQPTNTASIVASSSTSSTPGRMTISPASASGFHTPSTPRTMTRRMPSAGKYSAATEAGVMMREAVTGKPAAVSLSS